MGPIAPDPPARQRPRSVSSMKPLYRTAFSLAQWALGLAALAWALSEVDLGMLCKAVQSYSLAAMMPVFALAIADYTCMGFRLNALMPKGTGLALSMKGCLLCVGMNCLLPAKAGDALKILYLTRNTGQSFVTISSVVIWERLCDVIYLASLLLFAVPNMQADEFGVNMVVPAFVLCAGVLGFYTLRHWSGFFHALYARFLPSRIASPLSHLHSCMVDQVSIPWLARGLAWSACTWGTYFMCFVFSLYMADIHLTYPQMLVAFTISCLGTAIPSLPGGIGLFEGAVVLALSWFGVDASQALGMALFFHAVHFLPLALAAVIINGRARYWQKA